MPTYRRFEDLPVWKDAIRLAEGSDDLLEAVGKRLSWAKRDQLDRAALSASNNIVEGFERGITNELLAFLYIARGSAGEVRSMFCLFKRRPQLAAFRERILELKALAESCSRQLRAWADSLQNSDIKGQRHLNEESRQRFRDDAARKQGVQEFQQLLRKFLPPGHPQRPPG